ncbi:hypothetical protein EYR41_007652, partial [Orbilia oligospora]
MLTSSLTSNVNTIQNFPTTWKISPVHPFTAVLRRQHSIQPQTHCKGSINATFWIATARYTTARGGLDVTDFNITGSCR